MIKLAARAGILGPLLFGGVVTTLTILKYDFLLSLGWDPLYAPTFDWPSGLSLGKYGWIMICASTCPIKTLATLLRASAPLTRMITFIPFATNATTRCIMPR